MLDKLTDRHIFPSSACSSEIGFLFTHKQDIAEGQGPKSGPIALVGAVNEGENFGNDHIGCRRDLLVNFQSCKYFHQIGIFMDRDAMFFGNGNDAFGSRADTLADRDRSGILFGIVSQGDRLFAFIPCDSFFLLLVHEKNIT